jgi:predicted RNase H-like HicB family nuclease
LIFVPNQAGKEPSYTCTPERIELMNQGDVKMRTLTAYIEKNPETGLYVAVVPQIPGIHTHAEPLDELQKNLEEVIELFLEEMDSETRGSVPEFVGIQQIEVPG